VAYCVALGAFFFVFISGGVLVSIVDVEAEVAKPLMNTLGRYSHDTDARAEVRALTKAWDETVEEFKCCGVHSYGDWAENNPWFADREKKVPAPCCLNVVGNETSQVGRDDELLCG